MAIIIPLQEQAEDHATTVRLSLVDLSTVAPGTTEADALADSLRTARQAEALGYHRIWFAEHHLTAGHASHNPEVLIAVAAAQTREIRVGSGAVLLNHYSPLKVAEVFQQLHALFPDRIDLGLGRATAGPVIDLALRRDRDARFVDDHPEQVAEVLAWLHDSFPTDHPFARKPLMPSVSGAPQIWLLGSSPSSGGLAAQLGIGYAFASFINPPLAARALRAYAEGFRPRGFGYREPYPILSVNVTVADSDEAAERLSLSPKGFLARLTRGEEDRGVPAPEEALEELTAEQRDEPTQIVDGRWPRFVAGGPGRVWATLEQMRLESGAREIMIQDLIADPADRWRSHALLATAYGLAPREVAAPPRMRAPGVR
jgi:luciferase family oxidoreductase group 1